MSGTRDIENADSNADTFAVVLELYSHSHREGLLVFDSIETGLSVTMTQEAWKHAGEPATLTVLVPAHQLSRPAKLSDDAEPVA